MIKLVTPITIGPYTFDVSRTVRFEADFRSETAQGMLALVRSTPGSLLLGAEDDDGNPIDAPILRTYQLHQDKDNPDPNVTLFFQKLNEAIDFLEAALVTQKDGEGGLATAPEQIGLTKYSLDCTSEPLGNRVVGREKKDKIPKLKEPRKEK